MCSVQRISRLKGDDVVVAHLRKFGANFLRGAPQVDEIVAFILLHTPACDFLVHLLGGAESEARHINSVAERERAWLLVRRPWVVPIPGTKRLAFLVDNRRAPDLELSAEDKCAWSTSRREFTVSVTARMAISC